MRYKTILILSVVAFLWPAWLNAQPYERSSEETHVFKVYDPTTLEIYNKYGNIHLFPWDNDSVKIRIELNVKANKQSKVDKIFEYINFEFSNTKYYIIARTQLKQQGSFWSEVSDLANTLFSGNNKAQIDYYVYLPKDMPAKFENKFGNIYSTDHTGKLEVTISNGDFKANQISGYLELDLSFGNATIKSIESGKFIINYGELDLGKADELVMGSKSSTLNIEEVGSLSVNSKRDKFKIDKLTSLKGETSFSYVTLKNFTSDLTMKTAYGEVKLQEINSAFKAIDLTSNYTDILFTLPTQAAFSVDITHSEETGIIYPDKYDGLQTESIDKKEDIIKTSGIIGNDVSPTGKIKIMIKSGNVTFKEIY